MALIHPFTAKVIEYVKGPSVEIGDVITMDDIRALNTDGLPRERIYIAIQNLRANGYIENIPRYRKTKNRTRIFVHGQWRVASKERIVKWPSKVKSL